MAISDTLTPPPNEKLAFDADDLFLEAFRAVINGVFNRSWNRTALRL
jgi:hypothetical protein